MQSDPLPQGPRPSKYKPDEIMTYKKVKGIELEAHVFFPIGVGKTDRQSVFAFFHPGGWAGGEPQWGYDLCHRYALYGMVAISFQYRLSSVDGFTPIDAISDAKSAIRWIRSRSNELGIESSRIVAGGISAGGHLAASAAIIPGHDDPEDNMDISPVPNALALQSACLNPVLDEHFSNLLQGRDKPESCSPAHHIRAGLPPMCLLHGTADEIVSFDSIEEFVARTREEGNRCELYPFEGTDHFFVHNPNRARVPELMDNFLSLLGYIDISDKKG